MLMTGFELGGIESLSSSSAFEGDHASNDKSGGLDVGCGLQEVLFAAPELFLECCSVGPLLGSYGLEQRTEL